MSEEYEKEVHDGICLILPKYESISKAKKIGSIMIFGTASIDRFGFGWQFLKHGIIFEVGFIYLGICHIKKQSDFYEISQPLEDID